MKVLILLFLFAMPVVAWAELDKAYFARLQAERVESTDLVEWRQVGPGMSGYCEEFWCHPSDSKVIFMSPDMYNTYGTWDAGRSWHTIKDIDGDGRDMTRIRKFEFSRQDPAFGMALSAAGVLHVTHDTGRSWEIIKSFDDGRFAELTVDPRNDNNWYIGPGDFWNVKKVHRHKDGQSHSIPNDGIYRSTDRGKSWRKLKIGTFTDLDVGRIVVDPTNSNIIIAATNKGLYRSKDQGNTWKLSSDGLPVNRPRDLDWYYDPATGEFIIYLIEQTAFIPDGETVQSKGGVFKSVDHGLTWQDISGNLSVDLNKITSYPVRDKYWKSLAFWFQMDVDTVKQRFPKLPDSVFCIWHRIQVNPLNKDEIYLSHNNKHDKAFLPGGAWKSSDGGKHWIATARAGAYWIKGKDNTYWKSRGNPLGTNTVFAHLQPEMDRREELWGNRFLEISQDGSPYICLDQQVLESADGGTSWFQIDDNETAPGSRHWVGRGGSNLPGRFMLLETGIPDRYLLCSGEHGLWQTAPLGNYPDRMAVAVEQIEGQIRKGGTHSISTVAVHPDDPDIIYTLSWRQENRGKLRRSVDGGKSWENIATIFEAANPEFQGLAAQNSLLIDPVDPDNIYFCATLNMISEVMGPNAQALTKGEYGVYRSTDGGFNWEPVNKGFHTGFSVRRIAMDPNDPKRIYAAVNDQSGGLFVSENGADSWQRIRIPNIIEYVNNVFVDRNNGHLLIACGNERATDAGGGVWRSKDRGLTWEQIFDLPFIWQAESSPVNPDIILVSAALPHRAKDNNRLNPGAYLSLNGGATWNKINRGLGQHDRLVDLKPDPFREDVFWCAQKGSGWAVGYLKGTSKGWSQK